MFKYTDDVKITSSYKKQSKPYGKIENRATYAFIFKIKGITEYFFNGKSIKLKAGEAVFLQKSASYEYTSDGRNDSLYTSINFEGNFEGAEIKIYPVEDFYATSYIIDSFSELWKFGNASDKYKCLSVFYDFLSYISRLEDLKSEDKRKRDLIKPAINYLKSHIYDSEFRIDKLHRLCGISDTYFRKIFTKIFSKSPQEYVLSERIMHAKSIIDSGDYDTIKEIALSVGYNDSLYFSKAFKKFYGMSPSDIKR